MEKITVIIPNPEGYTFYIGADGFDAIPDADGYYWYADDFKAKGYFEARIYRYKDGVSEVIPLAQKINGAIRLNWTPAGLTASGSYQAYDGAPVEARVFQVPEYKQFTLGFPVVETQTIERTIDQGARDLYNAALALANSAKDNADSARSLAENAYNNAKVAQNTAGTALSAANNALNVANSKPSIDTLWGKINDRLFILAQAIRTNNRTDALDALWMDVLFVKTNDWIYGKLKDMGLIK